jgi:hypothetical protein
MTCRDTLDKIYDFEGEKPFSLWIRLQIAFHVVFCPRCAEKAARLEAARALMRSGFLPPSPELADAVMSRVYAQERDLVPDMPFEEEESSPEVSFGSWVFTGFIVLLSLSTAFMGMDFIKVASAQGSSFLLPVGITIGVVVTCYGALFIGSHLKELSDRFRLR